MANFRICAKDLGFLFASILYMFNFLKLRSNDNLEKPNILFKCNFEGLLRNLELQR